MLSEFGRPFDVELVGVGSLGLSWQEWSAIVGLGKAFGWAESIEDPPEGSAFELPFGKNFDGNPFVGEIQKVTEPAASGLAQALRAAITASDTNQELTLQQIRAIMPVLRNLNTYVAGVADFAARGGFLVKMRA